MLDKTITALRQQAGIKEVADLGQVFSGSIGYTACDVAVVVEEWQGSYFLSIRVTHKRGSSFRRTRTIKWPYSRNQPGALECVIEDFRQLDNALMGLQLHDQRTAFGRFMDRLTRRDYLGMYGFVSPLPTTPPTTVTAEVVRSGGEVVVTLTEKRPSSSPLWVQLPHTACASIRAALASYAAAV